MIDLVYWLRNLLFFDIPLLYYHVNLRSSINFCRYISFFWDISSKSNIFCFFVTVSELFCGEVIKNFIILSEILLPIKSPVVAYAAFLIVFFAVVLSAFVVDLHDKQSAWLTCFWLSLVIFLAKDTFNPCNLLQMLDF